MNMASAESANGITSYFIGVSMQALNDFFKGPEGKRFKSWERISISDAKAFGPGEEKIENAKEEIRAGNARVMELVGSAQVIVFT